MDNKLVENTATSGQHTWPGQWLMGGTPFRLEKRQGNEEGQRANSKKKIWDTKIWDERKTKITRLDYRRRPYTWCSVQFANNKTVRSTAKATAGRAVTASKVHTKIRRYESGAEMPLFLRVFFFFIGGFKIYGFWSPPNCTTTESQSLSRRGVVFFSFLR